MFAKPLTIIDGKIRFDGNVENWEVICSTDFYQVWQVLGCKAFGSHYPTTNCLIKVRRQGLQYFVEQWQEVEFGENWAQARDRFLAECDRLVNY